MIKEAKFVAESITFDTQGEGEKIQYCSCKHDNKEGEKNKD